MSLYTAGMSDIFSATARDIFDETAAAMRSAIAGASPEVLNRKPGGEDTNSITVLAVHAMHSTRWWLCVAVGAPLPARNRDDEFVTTMPDDAALLLFFDGMVIDCQRLFDGATVDDWSEQAQLDDDEGEVSRAWALLHALEHLGEHTGQIQLTRQLLQRDASLA